MGTRHTFQPYKDDPDEDSSVEYEDISDHQMFATSTNIDETRPRSRCFAPTDIAPAYDESGY